MTTINFCSRFIVRGGGLRHDSGCWETSPSPQIKAAGRQPRIGVRGAMAFRVARHPARDRLAANGAEDPPAFSPVRFRERGRLRRRAAPEFPGLRLLSPAIGLAPRLAGRALRQASPSQAPALVATADAPPP